MTDTPEAELAGPPTDDPDPAGGRGLVDLPLRRPPDCRPVVLSLPGSSSPGTVPPRLSILEGQNLHLAKIKEARHATPLRRL